MNAGYDRIGLLLRYRRIELSIGVRELARRIGKSPSLIVRIESDAKMPTLKRSTIEALALELQIDSDSLCIELGKAPHGTLVKTPEEAEAVRKLLEEMRRER